MASRRGSLPDDLGLLSPLPPPVHAGAPPPTTTLLGRLPDELADLILGRIACPFDHASVSRVCTEWRDLVGRLNPWPNSRMLPSLLLPDDTATGVFRVFCVLCGDGFHTHRNQLRIDPPDAQIFGSYEGAWLFLRGDDAITMFNVRTRESLSLPLFMEHQDGLRERMDIFTVALSSSPRNPICVGAAIVTAWRGDADPDAVCRRFLVFWRMGRELATVTPLSVTHRLEDVVHHDGAFYLLTRYGLSLNVVVYRHAAGGGAAPVSISHIMFRPNEPAARFLRGTRYVVASHDELLQVVRIHRTSSFKIYRATKRQATAEDALSYPWEWIEMKTMEGRVLFIGHGCSCCYDASDHPGGSGIYFLDDDFFPASASAWFLP